MAKGFHKVVVTWENVVVPDGQAAPELPAVTEVPNRAKDASAWLTAKYGVKPLTVNKAPKS